MTTHSQSGLFSAATQIGAHALAAIFSEAVRDVLEARGMVAARAGTLGSQAPLVLATVGFCAADLVGVITLAFESPRLSEPLNGHEGHRQHAVHYARVLLSRVAEAFQAALEERPVPCRIGLMKSFVVNELGEPLDEALAFAVSIFSAEEGHLAVTLDLDLPLEAPILGEGRAYSAEPGNPVLF